MKKKQSILDRMKFQELLNALNITKRQLFTIAAIVVFIFLMLDLNSRLSELNELSGQRDVLATDVTYLLATQSFNETQIAYQQSDKAVEDWAYSDGHMVRSGEKLIVPKGPTNVKSKTTPSPQPTPSLVENWEIWWALFTGK
jgi:cell division protein FtsB